jgi:CRISPR-associated protein Cas7/Cse4/CasC subtype I-E
MGPYVGTRTKYFPWLVGNELKSSAIPEKDRPGIVQAAMMIASAKGEEPARSKKSPSSDNRPKTPQLIHIGPHHARAFVETLVRLASEQPDQYRFYLNPQVIFRESLRSVLLDSDLPEKTQEEAVNCAWFLATSRREQLFSGVDTSDSTVSWSESDLGIPQAEAIAVRLSEVSESDPALFKDLLRKPKKEEKEQAGAEIKEPQGMKKFKEALFQVDRYDAVDIALFGRMTTSEAFADVEAAMQVAHAISTHAVVNEVDYFTAVDDLGATGGGAGHVDEAMFNSACFYKYFSLDWDQLLINLRPPSGAEPTDIPRQLAAAVLGHFLRAAALSSPSGKQNSHAAHNPPDAILVEVKSEKIPISYANAFADPVQPSREHSLVKLSVQRLASYAAHVSSGYGIASSRLWFSLDQQYPWPEVGAAESLASLEELIARTVKEGTGLEWNQIRNIGKQAQQEV